jgi:integrase
MEKFLRDVMAGKSVTRDSGDTKDQEKRTRGGVTKGGAGVASRTLGMLGTILERAVRDGVLAKNPVRGIARPKDRAKQPPFSFEVIGQLGMAMRGLEDEGENEVGLRAIRHLLLTGNRRMEGLTLQWPMVDRTMRCLRFTDTKSGRQTRAIGRAALDHLSSFRPEGAKPTGFVFPGDSKAGHFVGLPKVWQRVCTRASIDDVSLHGLRHWFASAATELGYSDLIIGALLGHAKKGITGRYATAPDPALVAAADRISLRLREALDGTAQSGKIVSISAA